jgi:hypothetical protein
MQSSVSHTELFPLDLQSACGKHYDTFVQKKWLLHQSRK